jgi:NADH-quinone oxidoreductase subunit C
LNTQEAIEKLKNKFGEKILEASSPRENRLYIKVSNDALVEAAKYLREELGFDMAISAGGTDYPKKNVIELFWIIWSSTDNVTLILKTDVDRENPKIPTLRDIWLGVQKFERETWELLGVEYEGHPNLKPLLLPEDWNEGYPLRKDFKLEPYRAPWGDEEK